MSRWGQASPNAVQLPSHRARRTLPPARAAKTPCLPARFGLVSVPPGTESMATSPVHVGSHGVVFPVVRFSNSTGSGPGASSDTLNAIAGASGDSIVQTMLSALPGGCGGPLSVPRRTSLLHRAVWFSVHSWPSHHPLCKGCGLTRIVATIGITNTSASLNLLPLPAACRSDSATGRFTVTRGHKDTPPDLRPDRSAVPDREPSKLVLPSSLLDCPG
jgi:hypothetical protein